MLEPKDVVDFINTNKFTAEAHEITENDRTDHCEGDSDGDYEGEPDQ